MCSFALKRPTENHLNVFNIVQYVFILPILSPLPYVIKLHMKSQDPCRAAVI